MDDFLKFSIFTVAIIILLWEIGSITFKTLTAPAVPQKPTSGYEHLEASCIAYIQAMPVCTSPFSRNLPSYLSPACKSYIITNIVNAPGCN